MNSIYVLCLNKDGIFDRPLFFRTFEEAQKRLVELFVSMMQNYNDDYGNYDDVIKRFGDPTKIPTEAFSGGAVLNADYDCMYRYILENSYFRCVFNSREAFSRNAIITDISAEVFIIERSEIPDEFNSEKYS